MIYLESRDSFIWNIDTKLVEIIKVALSTNEKIQISTSAEGPCLLSSNFYNKLDLICNTFDIDKTRFEIYTCNVEECHDIYKIIIEDNIWVNVAKKNNLTTTVVSKKLKLLTVGCFVGKINWARLSLLSWLDQYSEKTLLTCHYTYANDDSELDHQFSLQLNDNMQAFPNEIDVVATFLKTCPRRMPSNYILPCSRARSFGKDLLNQIVKISNFSEGYSDIFLELICETYFTGFTFFPTEKTFRPIQQLTPFITFGPQGFLSNLHRCGFKTFNAYWDERYDDYVGVERILKIRQILEQLLNLDQFALQEMYADMLPILEHNKNRLSTLFPKDLLLDE